MIPRFKVWDKRKKRWYKPEDALWLCLVPDIVSEEGALVDTARWSDQWLEIEHDNIEIVQFTTLEGNDKVGIYRGDILGRDDRKIPGKQTEFGRVVVSFGEYDDSDIEWGSEGIGWYVNGFHGYTRANGHRDEYDVHEQSLVRYICKYTVIGNRFENPELLPLLRKEPTEAIHDVTS